MFLRSGLYLLKTNATQAVRSSAAHIMTTMVFPPFAVFRFQQPRLLRCKRRLNDDLSGSSRANALAAEATSVIGFGVEFLVYPGQRERARCRVSILTGADRRVDMIANNVNRGPFAKPMISRRKVNLDRQCCDRSRHLDTCSSRKARPGVLLSGIFRTAAIATKFVSDMQRQIGTALVG